MSELKLKPFTCRCGHTLGLRFGNTLIIAGVSSTPYRRSQPIICEKCGERNLFKVNGRDKKAVEKVS